MKQLKVELYQYKNVIYGRVVSQDNSLLATSEECFQRLIISDELGYCIFSSMRPSLTNNTLNIRGADCSCDTAAFCNQFLNTSQATEALNQFKKLIKIINKKGD